MRYEFSALCGDSALRMLNSSLCLTVIAVHSQSVYMKGPGDRLLLICPDSYGSVPFGISLADFSFMRQLRDFKEGEQVLLEYGELIFSDSTVIKIDPMNANRVQADTVLALPDHDLICFCAEYVRESASRRGMAPSLPAFLCMGTPFDYANIYALSAAAEADRLELAFKCRDRSLLADSVKRFIGLGYGLTPSGDDFVCGMAYAFHGAVDISPDSSVFIEMLQNTVSEYFERTNEVSREYLQCALDGEHFEVVDCVLGCFFGQSDREKLKCAVDRLLSVGASSGSDILCGILFALYLLK